jgi:NADH dehydrogenase/NADH:ubiquinone oxidoreductase subunit G
MKTDQNNVNVFVNGISVQINKSASIINACDKLNIQVPRFCYHEKLKVSGNCRMCLVEVCGAPKPITACATPVMNGMEILTDTPKVKKARENILETLLINHPLDCPICDQAGECDLQEQSLIFGKDRGRFSSLKVNTNEKLYKRAVQDKNYGIFIKTIMSRCIHCTRCVRFAKDIGGVHSIGTTGRGVKSEIGQYINKFYNSELSGNIIDLCPVGALTSKPYAFQERSWSFKNFEAIDVFNSLGSNIKIETRGANILRILPKENIYINEEWIDNKTRFNYDGINKYYTKLKESRDKIFNFHASTNSKSYLCTAKPKFVDESFSIYHYVPLNNPIINQNKFVELTREQIRQRDSGTLKNIVEKNEKIELFHTSIREFIQRHITKPTFEDYNSMKYVTISSKYADFEDQCFLKEFGSSMNELFEVNNRGINVSNNKHLANDQKSNRSRTQTSLNFTELKYNLNLDSRTNYSFNTAMIDMEQSDLVLFVGVNTRTEATLLNARLRKLLKNTPKADNLTFASIGSSIELTYPILQLGTSPTVLTEIAKGKHPFCKRLMKAKKPIIICGMEIAKRKDSNALQSVLNHINQKLNDQKQTKNNYINYLLASGGSFGAYELGLKPFNSYSNLIVPGKSTYFGKFDTKFFFHLFNTEDVNIVELKQQYPNCLVIYQGNQANLTIAERSLIDLYLPYYSFLEKVGLYFNLEGRLQIFEPIFKVDSIVNFEPIKIFELFYFETLKAISIHLSTKPFGYFTYLLNSLNLFFLVEHKFVPRWNDNFTAKRLMDLVSYSLEKAAKEITELPKGLPISENSSATRTGYNPKLIITERILGHLKGIKDASKFTTKVLNDNKLIKQSNKVEVDISTNIFIYPRFFLLTQMIHGFRKYINFFLKQDNLNTIKFSKIIYNEYSGLLNQQINNYTPNNFVLENKNKTFLEKISNTIFNPIIRNYYITDNISKFSYNLRSAGYAKSFKQAHKKLKI